MSRNSWLVGTAGMSFHWVFILAGGTSDVGEERVCELSEKSAAIDSPKIWSSFPTRLAKSSRASRLR